jgi:hypothetical protein
MLIHELGLPVDHWLPCHLSLGPFRHGVWLAKPDQQGQIRGPEMVRPGAYNEVEKQLAGGLRHGFRRF